MYGCFPEYHTSADNLDFVSEKNLRESLELYLGIINTYEINCKFSRKNAFCEPQMGKYNMYREVSGGGEDNLDVLVQQRMWLLNYADGKTDLLTISEKSGFSLSDLKNTLAELIEAGLIIKEQL
jgi:aminopeptidase-like protein